MGFTLANSVSEKAAEIALAMGNSDNAVVIPGTPDMVLVRQGSKAFLERKDNAQVFMIPVNMKTVIDGVEAEMLFFVCTG